MKKGIVLFLACQMALTAMAQEKKTDSYADSLLSRWCIDVNILAGGVSQGLTTSNTLGNYPNAISSVSNAGNVKFTNGSSIGGEAQLGFFFGHKRHWGIGTGVIYLSQHGDATLDNFHVEYQSTDPNGHTFRQVVTGSNVKESLNITNFNIPLVLKYKKRFSEHWGFTVDGGLLFNLQMKNKYTTNAAFDYEAIYQSADGNNFTYDNAATPSTNDVFWTKAAHSNNGSGISVQDYFAAQRAAGYNVGLGVKPNSTTGNTSYTTGNVGFIISPAVSYYVSDHVAFNLGLNYIYQPFKNSVPAGYQLTNKVGDYNSITNSTSAIKNSTYGVNLGVRIFFGKPKDTDHDGIPDKFDQCPDVFGLAKFNGCPDRDGDGIPDKDDSCADVFGLAQFHGCPDTDGDGIPDKDDACPTVFGLAQFHGCPDTDGDGIPDKDDACPTVKGLLQFHGCPDTDGDGIPDNEDNCPTEAGPVSNHGCPIPPPPPVQPEPAKDLQPILFQTNKTVLEKKSLPTIEEAAAEAKSNKDALIEVDGYTDSRGTKKYNKALSIKRAKAVKSKLTKLGVSPKQVKIAGHGESKPVESNKTKEGRKMNRRAELKVENGK